MATHSSILAWKSLWTEESGRLSPWDYMTEHVCTRVEGNGLVAIKWYPQKKGATKSLKLNSKETKRHPLGAPLLLYGPLLLKV